MKIKKKNGPSNMNVKMSDQQNKMHSLSAFELSWELISDRDLLIFHLCLPAGYQSKFISFWGCVWKFVEVNTKHTDFVSFFYWTAWHKSGVKLNPFFSKEMWKKSSFPFFYHKSFVFGFSSSFNIFIWFYPGIYLCLTFNFHSFPTSASLPFWLF